MGALNRAISIAKGQRHLAAAIGVSQGRISQWVNGEPIHNKYFGPISAATEGKVTPVDLLNEQLSRHAERGIA